MHVTIRAVREDDAPAIVDLLNPIIRAGTYTIMDEVATVEDQIRFIRDLPERAIYHAAAEGERLLGIQDVLPLPGADHIGDVSTFISLSAHRGGIGRGLSRATFERARELEYRKLTATIRADNPGAVSFYRSLGFRVIGTALEHARVGERYVDEVLTELLLSGE